MMLRPAKLEDWAEIERLARNQDFPLTDFKAAAASQVIEENNKLLAFGLFERKLEASIMLDLDQTRRRQIDALKILMSECVKESYKQGYDSVYAFVKDKDFCQLLQKHFGWKIANGTSLYLRNK